MPYEPEWLNTAAERVGFNPLQVIPIRRPSPEESDLYWANLNTLGGIGKAKLNIHEEGGATVVTAEALDTTWRKLKSGPMGGLKAICADSQYLYILVDRVSTKPRQWWLARLNLATGVLEDLWFELQPRPIFFVGSEGATPRSIATDGEYIYIHFGGTIARLAVSGEGYEDNWFTIREPYAHKLYESPVGTAFCVDERYLYWSSEERVARCNKEGGEVNEKWLGPDANLRNTRELAVADGYLWASVGVYAGVPSAVIRARLDASALERAGSSVLTDEKRSFYIGFDSEYLYFTKGSEKWIGRWKLDEIPLEALPGGEEKEKVEEETETKKEKPTEKEEEEREAKEKEEGEKAQEKAKEEEERQRKEEKEQKEREEKVREEEEGLSGFEEEGIEPEGPGGGVTGTPVEFALGPRRGRVRYGRDQL